MKYVQTDIQSLLSFIFKKLSDIVASFINTGQMQYCVLPFYFFALCLPLLFFVLALFKFKPNIFFVKARGKAAKTPASRQPAEEFKF